MKKVMIQNHLALLEKLGAHRTSHSRRTLMAHLQGTWNLLAEWGNPPAVCVAGLLHSVYGTYIFDGQCADVSRRGTIREVIGSDAERLVYVFGVTDRRCFYEHLGESHFRLRDIRQNSDLELDAESLAVLIEIEVANIVDQIPYRSRKKALAAAELYAGAFARSRDYISPQASQAAQVLFARLRSPTIEA